MSAAAVTRVRRFGALMMLALASLLVGTAQQHKDNLKDVDNHLLLDALQGYHIQLRPNPDGQALPIAWQGYRPIGVDA